MSMIKITDGKPFETACCVQGTGGHAHQVTLSYHTQLRRLQKIMVLLIRFSIYVFAKCVC